MEDEACTTYSANIDQMTEGHQFVCPILFSSSLLSSSLLISPSLLSLSLAPQIWETFGVVPKYGWQVNDTEVRRGQTDFEIDT